MRLASFFAVSIATLSLASLIACGAETAAEAPAGAAETDDGEAQEIKAAVIDESDNNKTIPITLGRSFTIAVSDNASTGFVWSVKSVDRTIGQPKVTQVPGDSSRPGASGLKKFTWSTKSPLNLIGKHVIVLEHARGAAAGTLLTITVDIKDPAGTAASCAGLAGIRCKTGTYCDFTLKAHCGAGDQTGTCDTKPAFCPAVMMPVCGCDGRTYNNSCEANRGGVSVSGPGPCAAPPQMQCGNKLCAVGLVCCNSLAGICTKPGEFCIQ